MDELDALLVELESISNAPLAFPAADPTSPSVSPASAARSVADGFQQSLDAALASPVVPSKAATVVVAQVSALPPDPAATMVSDRRPLLLQQQDQQPPPPPPAAIPASEPLPPLLPAIITAAAAVPVVENETQKSSQTSPPPTQTLPLTPAMHCAACKEEIAATEAYATALDQMWHLHHLACSVCAKQLTATTFFEHHGELLCAAHHAERAAPRCAYCAGAITDRLVTALNKPWHVDHFFCSQCGTNLVQATGFMEHDGKPYCADDYFTLFAPACGRCAKPVMADCITALNKSWHPGCFTCATCSGVFAGGTFFAHEGLAYCEMDFHRAKGTLCEGCLKPIVGKCVNAAGRRWHPQCFLCSYCKTSLNKNPFREREGKAFCVPCHTRLYG